MLSVWYLKNNKYLKSIPYTIYRIYFKQYIQKMKRYLVYDESPGVIRTWISAKNEHGGNPLKRFHTWK